MVCCLATVPRRYAERTQKDKEEKETMSSAMFSPISLRGLTLPNYVVVLPMCQYASDDDSANGWYLMHLGQFALGAAGLVMTEETDVNPEIVASGQADLVALACGMMYDPRWVWHAAEDLGAETPYAPKSMPCHPKIRPEVFPDRRQAAE